MILSFLKPGHLTPFSIRQKQEGRSGSSNKVAYIQYIEIFMDGDEYRLLKKKDNKFVFTVNGLKKPNDYIEDDGSVKTFLAGGNIVFTTEFGLTVTWNGDHKADITLCDTYSNYVCGLCGNADSK